MPDWEIENSLTGSVCGIDEVGRAPLAGPVVAVCAFIPKENRSLDIWSCVNDSKRVTRKRREAMYDELCGLSCYGIGRAEVGEIDEINIYHASLLAMKRSFASMCRDFSVCPDTALVDGNAAPDITCNTRTVIKGDAASLSIAAASIIAKVWRDRLMCELHDLHPHYGWNKNAGYGTKEHMEGIDSAGITEHHRRSFAPVRNYIEHGTTRIQSEMEL